jgi:hypothetical protein
VSQTGGVPQKSVIMYLGCRALKIFMPLDVWIAALIAALTIAMAYMGVHITIHPLDESPRRRLRYKCGFAVCAAGAIALVAWQGVRNYRGQDELHRLLVQIQSNTKEPPKIQVSVPPPTVITVPADSKPRTVSLFLDCQAIPLPIASPPGVAVTLLDPGFQGGVFMQWYPAATEGWPDWIGKTPLENRIYRCELTNFSDFEVFDVLLPVKVGIQKALWDRDNVSCVGQVSTRIYAGGISALKRNGGVSAFFIYNSSRDCASFTAPTEATISGPKGTTRVPLKLGGDEHMKLPMFLGPALR